MYAQLTYFDGPHTQAQVDAFDFASTHRITPAVADVPGALQAYVLRRADGSGLVVSFAETEAALADTQKAIMATDLLPGEDPALLTGPDRVEIYPVVHEYHPGGDS
ncbi:hypothetical protein GCM10029964_080360 [Kibdelosporangium lantanae]